MLAGSFVVWKNVNIVHTWDDSGIGYVATMGWPFGHELYVIANVPDEFDYQTAYDALRHEWTWKHYAQNGLAGTLMLATMAMLLEWVHRLLEAKDERKGMVSS